MQLRLRTSITALPECTLTSDFFMWESSEIQTRKCCYTSGCFLEICLHRVPKTDKTSQTPQVSCDLIGEKNGLVKFYSHRVD